MMSFSNVEKPKEQKTHKKDLVNIIKNINDAMGIEG